MPIYPMKMKKKKKKKKNKYVINFFPNALHSNLKIEFLF